MNVRRPLLLASLTIAFAVAAIWIQGCSDRQPVAASIPPVDAGDAFHVRTDAGGMATELTAYFDGDHLHRIVETRTGAAGSPQRGDYRFTQARLTAYAGDALQSGRRIELAFDLHGALTASTPEVDQDTLAAIRNRAQLLRSLALARRSTQQHSALH